RQMLEHTEYEVVAEAKNGLEAVRTYEMCSPDVVTMDITMPEMDGIQAVKEIRRLDPKAKIIMCSAMGQQQLVVQAIQSGASDFVVKPFQKDRVIDSLRKVLG